MMILVSSIPLIIVFLWFRFAKYQYSVNWFLLAVLSGATAFYPALILQDIFPSSNSYGSRIDLFYENFIRIAFTEELSRLLLLFIFFWIVNKFHQRISPSSLNKNSDDDSIQPLSFNVLKQGTAAGLVAGLGFSVIENVLYAASDVSVLILRVVTASLLHAACGARIGSAVVMFRHKPLQGLFRVFAAIAIHGVYNLMISRPGFPMIAAIFVAISTLVSSVLFICSVSINKKQ